MKLEKKKSLAARTLNVGEGRIVLNVERLQELKEKRAIIKKEKKGRRKVERRKTRRREGSIKKKVKTKKQDYVKLTRKLRTYLANLKNQKKISKENFFQISQISPEFS